MLDAPTLPTVNMPERDPKRDGFLALVTPAVLKWARKESSYDALIMHRTFVGSYSKALEPVQTVETMATEKGQPICVFR